MKILHPFMPFLTEELWQTIAERSTDEALIITQQKDAEPFQLNVLNDFDFAKEVISGIRNYRQSKGISPREQVEIYTNAKQIENQSVIEKLAQVSAIHFW